MTEKKKSSEPNLIKESAIPYGIRQFRGYTVEDYRGLPEDQRVELINGVFYDMASPTVRHQQIAMSVSVQMANYVEGKKKNASCWRGLWMYSLAVTTGRWLFRILLLSVIRKW